MKAWEEYEATVTKVVADLGEQLGIASVDGKQTVFTDTGRSFEIDAKAWCKDDHGYLLVEAKRHTRAGPSKDVIASLGYKIIKLKAAGGVIVSVKPLQSGAQELGKV